MKEIPVTKVQLETYLIIKEFIEEYSYSPTISYVGRKRKVTEATARESIGILLRKGLLKDLSNKKYVKDLVLTKFKPVLVEGAGAYTLTHKQIEGIIYLYEHRGISIDRISEIIRDISSETIRRVLEEKL